MASFDEYFLQIWDWIADQYSKGSVLTKSSGDSMEAARKGTCATLSLSLDVRCSPVC